ncbi:MAG: TlpA disulfide reductase family protein [Dehalococcoidia bacterium]
MALPEAPSSARRRLAAYLSLPRAIAAALLLAGLFALLYFVLRPDGGTGSVMVARMVDTPPGASDASEGVHPGRLARDFEASDLDDLRFRLSELRDRPVVINFWATWCTSCLAEMPALEQQRLARQSEDLAIVAVNVGESLDDAREFIDALGLHEFDVAMDPDLTISDAYSVRGLPHSVFIDREGVIQAEYQGQLNDDVLDGYVQAAIDATPGREPDPELRLVTTVPREHVLEVLSDEETPGEMTFRSRRFRCEEEDYCGDALVAEIRTIAGVSSVERVAGATTPSVAVRFDERAVELAALVDAVAQALRGYPDPLYTRDLEVRYQDG